MSIFVMKESQTLFADSIEEAEMIVENAKNDGTKELIRHIINKKTKKNIEYFVVELIYRLDTEKDIIERSI